MRYTQENNSKRYNVLNKLVVAKITSHPDERTLAKIPTLTGVQILRAVRHINRIQERMEV